MMKKILFLILLSSLLIVGCSCEEKEAVQEEGGGFVLEGEKVSGEVYTVMIEDNKFVPVDLEIKVGDTVEWVNKDDEHTVTFENGDFNERLGEGGTTSYVFTEGGEFRYFCTIHPGMQGEVVVS